MWKQDWLFVYQRTTELLPNGNLVSGSHDNTIKIWDLKENKCVKTLEEQNYVNCLCILPNGHLASGNSEGTIKIWNLETGEVIRTF